MLNRTFLVHFGFTSAIWPARLISSTAKKKLFFFVTPEFPPATHLLTAGLGASARLKTNQTGSIWSEINIV